MPENTVTHIIAVPLDSNSPYQRAKMKQADSGRILQVNMTFNGQPLIFPADTAGEFRAHKPDNTYIDQTSNVVIAGDVATVEIDSNTLAVAGDVVCDLVMSYNGKTLGIVNFIIDVMPGAIPKDAIESSDDWQALSEAASAAQAAAGRAENAASQSEDILTRIEEVEHNPVRVDPVTATLWNWDSTTQSWVDSGVSVAGSGDMQSSVYDPAGGARQVAFADEGSPPGSIMAYAGPVAPPGYLLCNGQAVSRTEYADLFAVIGTTFGSGDGSTTFNVPDLRNRFAIGFDANLGATGGGETHEHTLGNGHARISYSSGTVYMRNKTVPNWEHAALITGTRTTETGANTAASYLGGSTDPVAAPLPPYLALAFIIKI